MAIQVEVWGDYACFSRPEMKVERVSYDIITPSAARGLLESVFWHPGLKWQVDRIRVCNPIQFTNIRRNEIRSTLLSSSALTAAKGKAALPALYTAAEIQQRAALILKKPHYVIECHFTLTSKAAPGDNPGKFQDILRRRLEQGQFYHQPYFGCREFPANFRPCAGKPSCPETLRGECDLGYMLYDMDYSDRENIRPRFFRAKLRDGVLLVPPPDSGEVLE